jgi:hypothetical protein
MRIDGYPAFAKRGILGDDLPSVRALAVSLPELPGAILPPGAAAGRRVKHAPSAAAC